MKHPGMWCKDYDQYKEEMARWNKQPFSVEKKTAESEYAMYIKNRKEKEMATTFNIKKRENAPEFVFGSFGCKLEDLKAFVNDKGYINFDILKGKEGGYYVKVSDYGLKKNTAETVAQGEVLEFEKMPF